MKLFNYLRENQDPDNLINDVGRDCQPWLKATEHLPHPLLYRGEISGVGTYKVMKSHLKDRKSKDTPDEIHALLNDAFKEEFGWPARNGVFTTSNINDASSYGGRAYIFMPVGKYEYVWSSEISDLYNDIIESEQLITDIDKNWYNDDPQYIYYINGIESMYYEVDTILPDNMHIDELEPNKVYKLKMDNKIYKVVKKILSFEDFVKQSIEEQGYITIEELMKLYRNNSLDKAIKSEHEIMFKCDKYYLISRMFEPLILKTFYE